MIKIESDAVHECGHDEAKTTIELTGLDRGCKPAKKNCNTVKKCEFESPFLLTPGTPSSGSVVIVPTRAFTTTVQVFNNDELLNTLTIDLAPLAPDQFGNAVFETQFGIKLVNIVNSYGLTGKELSLPASQLALQWNGSHWIAAL